MSAEEPSSHNSMREVSDFIAGVKEKFKDVKEQLSEVNSVVNFNHIDDISNTITNITDTRRSLMKILEEITSVENDYKTEYSKHLDDVRKMMEKRGILNASSATVPRIPSQLRNGSNALDKPRTYVSSNGEGPVDDWTVVSKKKNGKSNNWLSGEPSHSVNGMLTYTVNNVRITDKIMIPDVRTTHSLPPSEKLIKIIDPGYLYYSHAADTFFILMQPGNMLLYGNIGEITAPVGSPSKVKDCKYFPCKYNKCDFYHDPFKYPGSSERRNFIINSWEYSGAMSNQKRQSEQSRIVGSRSNLDIDVQLINESQMNLYSAQLMHDLLVYYVTLTSH